MLKDVWRSIVSKTSSFWKSFTSKSDRISKHILIWAELDVNNVRPAEVHMHKVVVLGVPVVSRYSVSIAIPADIGSTGLEVKSDDRQVGFAVPKGSRGSSDI